MPANFLARRTKTLRAAPVPRLVVCALGLVLVATTAAAQAKHPITVEEMWAVKRPGVPSLSPDGRWAAVELTSYDMKENKGASDIWLLATDGSAQRRLTAHSGRSSSPAWSPDGNWIAFLAKREGDEETQVYLISPTGGEARRMTTIPTGASALKWFPDSKRVAFLSWVWPELATEEEQAQRLKDRRDAKVKAYIIETTGFRYWDHWLADGRVPHVFFVEVETGKHRDILAGAGVSLVRHEPSAGFYDISPDGTEIAFTADLTKDFGYDPNEDIVTIPVAGGKWTNLTADNPANDTNPRYSPDAKWIAYTRQAIKSFYADRERIVLYERATGAKRVLTESWDRSAEAPVWSADSRRLYFGAEDKAKQPIWVLPIAGGDPKPLVAGGTISSLARSGDGRALAFLRTTMGLPPAVYVVSADGTGERKIEAFNDSLVAGWQLGEVKEVIYRGWGDEPIHMWVIFPPGFDPTKKWPLLQIVHGGPHGAWMNQFHFRWNMHLFASRGYVVAAVNFHSSTGWGQAFTDSTTGDYGRRELEDVEKGTDYLLEKGYIDPARLAAAGGSFGGYMMAWMNGHTTRYKAMVCHAGVYDWISQMASDTVRGRDRALGAFPWENPQKVLQQSPHFYAKNFKTPTLVVHDEQDFRVPVTQGFEYYTTLRMLDVPARLLYFPDENHWVLKPQNSRLWYKEFFDWIEKYAAAGPR
jgi:dipeptidyl aminopeptidase/acylaminoacyl peptidase